MVLGYSPACKSAGSVAWECGQWNMYCPPSRTNHPPLSSVVQPTGELQDTWNSWGRRRVLGGYPLLTRLTQVLLPSRRPRICTSEALGLVYLPPQHHYQRGDN